MSLARIFPQMKTLMRKDFPFEAFSIMHDYPQSNLMENDKQFIIEADLAGYPKQNINIEAKEDCLILSGFQNEKKEEKNEKIWFKELSEEKFQRVFSLPSKINVEHVKADFKDGVLKVVAAKSDKESSIMKKIKIS